MSWLGNFLIDRGFAWELLTFSSISTRRIVTENSHKHSTAVRVIALAEKNLFCPGFVAFVRSFWIEGFESARNSWLGNRFDHLAGKPTNFI